jgi:thiamine-monophosphate kinase
MDISDGIVGDVKKMCSASGVGARIDSIDIPISSAVKRAAEVLHRDAFEIALAGGEDYELLLAVAPYDVDDVMAAVNDVGTTLTAVGEIVKTGLRVVAPNGIDELNPDMLGWDHFATPA